MLVGISEAIRLLFFKVEVFLTIKFIHFLIKECSALIDRKSISLIFNYILSPLPYFLKLKKLSISLFRKEFGIKQIKVSKYFLNLYLKVGQIRYMMHLNSSNDVFNQWLAGLIDGNSKFSVSKKGYASLEIVKETRDKHCLYQIKDPPTETHKICSIKLRSGVKRLRYRIHHRKGMLDLINAVNGEIRNPTRLLQLNKFCDLYNIPII